MISGTRSGRRERARFGRIPARASVVLGMTIAFLAGSLPSFATHNGPVLGAFEGDDGNLVNEGTTDWNDFTDATTADAWNFQQFPDDTGNPDDIFGGGVKQDDECAQTKEGSMGGGNSKFDLARFYLAHQNVDSHVLLALSWVRVPSSPTASSHVAYEFNKGTDGACNGLIKRVEDDMLVVYDFAGGEADSTVRMTRWITSGECEVKQSTPPCWGNPQDLTALGFAEAKVNNPSVGNVDDDLAGETLVPVQFGETAIDLTAAGVFAPDTCEDFGFVTAVSRSSGNSGIAQMKDKVGPDRFDLANCGSVLVHKLDDEEALLAGATIKITPADNIDSEGEVIDEEDVTTMDELTDGVFCTEELAFGDYVVFETEAPEGYTGDDTKFAVTIGDVSTCAGRIADEDDPDVEITNVPEPGRVLLDKTDDDSTGLAGVQFELFSDDDESGDFDEAEDTTTGRTCTTDEEGKCRDDDLPDPDPAPDDRPAFDDVAPGFYCVVEVESTIPGGYAGAEPQCFEVVIAAGGDTIELTFENPRLHKVIVIVCHTGTDTLAASDATLGDPSDPDDATTTLAEGSVTAQEEAFLCGLDGFGDLEHGGARVNVDVGSDAH